MVQSPETGLIQRIARLFYSNNHIHYKPILLLSSAAVVTTLGINAFLKNSKRGRIRYNKLYYKSYADALQYIHILLRFHLPLSLNSVLIISDLRYMRSKGEKFEYNDIAHGYGYGFINFAITIFVNDILSRYVYPRFPQHFTVTFFEKYVLSPAESTLVRQMTAVNQILHQKLAESVENVAVLEQIIWEYIGPRDEAVNYEEFEEVLEYVHVLKAKLEKKKRSFAFGRYWLERAMNIFDFRSVMNHPLWSRIARELEESNHQNAITLSLRWGAMAGVYFVKLFGTMTLSQIWYIVMLEVSGNHDLLQQYLYSLMGREPLYLMVGFPFFVFRFVRFRNVGRPDQLSGAVKDTIVNYVMFIVQSIFGKKGVNV